VTIHISFSNASSTFSTAITSMLAIGGNPFAASFGITACLKPSFAASMRRLSICPASGVNLAAEADFADHHCVRIDVEFLIDNRVLKKLRLTRPQN
jgi:hypothetical protein